MLLDNIVPFSVGALGSIPVALTTIDNLSGELCVERKKIDGDLRVHTTFSYFKPTTHTNSCVL